MPKLDLKLETMEPRTDVQLARASALTTNKITNTVARKLEPTTTARARVQLHDQTHTHAWKPAGKHTRSQHTMHTRSQTITNTLRKNAQHSAHTRKQTRKQTQPHTCAITHDRQRSHALPILDTQPRATTHLSTNKRTQPNTRNNQTHTIALIRTHKHANTQTY